MVTKLKKKKNQSDALDPALLLQLSPGLDTPEPKWLNAAPWSMLDRISSIPGNTSRLKNLPSWG